MDREEGEEGERGGIRGPGQITSEVHAPSHQSSSTGTARDWGVGELTMIGTEVLSSTRVMDVDVGTGGGGRVGSGR